MPKPTVNVKMDAQNLMLLEAAARRLKDAALRDAMQLTGAQKELAQLTAAAWGELLTKAAGAQQRLQKLLKPEAQRVLPAVSVPWPITPEH